MRKAKWFNDYLSPVILGDDLSNSYYDYDSYGRNLYAKYDFGYGALNSNSIFKYFEENLLKKYPEIRYTVFIVVGRHSSLMPSKYAVSREFMLLRTFRN